MVAHVISDHIYLGGFSVIGIEPWGVRAVGAGTGVGVGVNVGVIVGVWEGVNVNVGVRVFGTY